MSVSREDVSSRVQTAFHRLLEEKPYRAISFKEIAAESGMSRQNLYYYYKSKDQILEDVIETFFDGIYDTMMQFDPAEIGRGAEQDLGKELIRATLIKMRDNEKVARCLFAEDISPIAIEKQVAFLRRILGGIIRARNIRVNDPKFVHYLALQISGAAHQVVREWLMVDRDFPIERIVELGHPMIYQVVRSLENN